jgi:hypothetical protein
MKMRYTLAIGAALLALGYWIGRHTAPEKVVKVDKEVNKVEYVDVVREVVRPDGTRERETRREERREQAKDKTTTIENKIPQYEFTAMYGKTNSGGDVLGIMIERRMFANIKAGVWANTEKQIGIGVSYEW